MANDVSSDDRNHSLDAHPVAQETEGEGRRSEERRVTESSLGVAALVREFRRELARYEPIEDQPLALVPISPEVKLARLERRQVELEWALYALLGAFLFLFLVRR